MAAVRAVAAGPRDVVMLLAGDGPQRAETTALVQRLLPGRARILGEVADVRKVLAASDVLLLPSLTEGVPAILGEAGLVGIPVVATDVGGVSTVVEDGVTGLLVPAGDERAFEQAVLRSLSIGPELGRRRDHSLSGAVRPRDHDQCMGVDAAPSQPMTQDPRRWGEGRCRV